MVDDLESIPRILLLVPGFVLGLTLHEFSHALAAYRLGDRTAADQGRLTLNPLAHLDLFGSLMLVLAGFGWAKPVPVDARFLRSPRRDMAVIAVAGPLANILLAAVTAALIRISGPYLGGFSETLLLQIAVQAVWINIILAIFNLIPLPPLDGSRIFALAVPDRWSDGYERLERVGPFVLFGLVVLASATGVSVFGKVILPVAQPLFRLVMGV